MEKITHFINTHTHTLSSETAVVSSDTMCLYIKWQLQCQLVELVCLGLTFIACPTLEQGVNIVIYVNGG